MSGSSVQQSLAGVTLASGNWPNLVMTVREQ